MSTPIIVFQGLMLFQTDAEKKKQVAIVDDRNGHHTNPHFQIWRLSDTGSYVLYTKKKFAKHDVVSFNSSTGKITPSKLYKKHVPELRKFIFEGDVDPNVVKQRALFRDGVMAFVNLPAGDVTTWGTLKPSVALIDNRGFPHDICFARFTILIPEEAPTEMTVKHNKDKKPYPLEPDDLIFISNIGHMLDIGIPGGPKVGHFSLYGKLLSATSALAEPKVGKLKCPMDGKGQFAKPIERHFQHEATKESPGGDCGPTGP